MLTPLGPVRVSVPGTPVRATSAIPDTLPNLYGEPGSNFTCHAALFQALPTNTGLVYIGAATMNKTTLAGVLAVLAVPTANSIPSFSVALTLAPAGIDLSDVYIDAANATEGVLVSILIT